MATVGVKLGKLLRVKHLYRLASYRTPYNDRGRSSHVSWGHGGQVRRRSSAERAGMKVGDLVLAISDVTADSLTHQKMLDLVGRQQLTLPLTLAR